MLNLIPDEEVAVIRDSAELDDLGEPIDSQPSREAVRCVVCPGPTPTALNTPEQLATIDQEFAALCGNHMDGNVPEVSADDQAHAILFFASDEAKGVNGQVLTVDNGMTI